MLNHNKRYILAMVFLAAAIMLLGFWAYALFGVIAKGSAQILSDKKEVAMMELQNKIVGDFKAKHEQYRADLQKINQLFVDSENPIDFITFLESVSADTGASAQINVVAPVKSENQKAGRQIGFEITIDGRYQNILRFAEGLENGPYLVKITNATVRGLQKDDTGKEVPQGFLEANFSVEALPK